MLCAARLATVGKPVGSMIEFVSVRVRHSLTQLQLSCVCRRRLCVLSDGNVNMTNAAVDLVHAIYEDWAPSGLSQIKLDVYMRNVMEAHKLSEPAVATVPIKSELAPVPPAPGKRNKPVGMFCTVQYISEFCCQDASESAKSFMGAIKNISALKLLTQFLTWSLYEWAFVDLKAKCQYAVCSEVFIKLRTGANASTQTCS